MKALALSNDEALWQRSIQSHELSLPATRLGKEEMPGTSHATPVLWVGSGRPAQILCS